MTFLISKGVCARGSMGRCFIYADMKALKTVISFGQQQNKARSLLTHFVNQSVNEEPEGFTLNPSGDHEFKDISINLHT